MGCFWGAERKFWRQKGVSSTQVGYAGGYTPNPSNEEVCSDIAGKICFKKVLKVFWESHNPTQGIGFHYLSLDSGMHQGNDVGTQYHFAIYPYTQEQMDAVSRSKEEYQKVT
ncbi:MSRA reductase, partial [Polyodon spathula]|nr:MSRA reductase [Polyodon spathula]